MYLRKDNQKLSKHSGQGAFKRKTHINPIVARHIMEQGHKMEGKTVFKEAGNCTFMRVFSSERASGTPSDYRYG